MNYSKEIVNGYDFLTKLSLLRRRASDSVSGLTASELNASARSLEDSIFYLEEIENVHGSLDECISSSQIYLCSLRNMLDTRTNVMELNLLRDAISDAEESAALLEDIRSTVDGYKSY